MTGMARDRAKPDSAPSQYERVDQPNPHPQETAR